MSSTGYGICGHQNAFSTGVKCGNYVEDRIGAELALRSQIQPLARESEASANYVDPKTMPDKSHLAPADNPSERFLIRSGLPYNLVFEHGKPHVPTTTELTTKYTTTASDIGRNVRARPATLQESGALQHQLAIQRSKERREVHHGFVTTAQAALPSTCGTKRG